MGSNLGHEFNVEKVKRLILEKGWTYYDMAERCGCDRSQISQILRVGRCRANTLGMIAQALGVEVVDILHKEKEEIQKIKVMLDPGAITPTRAHEADAGLDMYAREYDRIPPHGITVIDTGVHVAIPKGYVGLLTSKSGLMAEGVTSRGTIDSGYTGSIRAALFNHRKTYVHIEKGQKITQLVLLPIITPEVEIVDSLEDTERGTGGFGSTGKF